MKFTVIYTHTWTPADDHEHQIVKICRTEKRPDETIEDMLLRYGLRNDVQFLFLGNPQLLQDNSTTEENV